MAERENGTRTGPLEGDPFDWFLRIPNRLDLVQAVRVLARTTLESRGVDDEDLEEILLVISEVVNNSIEHVVGKGPEGYHEVDVQFGMEGDHVVARVVDEGEGALADGAFDIQAPPDLTNDRGRGLFLIRAFVDDLSVRPLPGVGTEVRFSKKVRIRAAGGGA